MRGKAQVVAIASRHKEHAAKVAEEFGIEYVARDWQELVERDDIDLVSVVTPPSTHMEITLAALDRGKAVLCEKPMAMNAAEARQMADRASEAGVLALIDHELRFVNSRIKMRAMLNEGAIGKVLHGNYVFRSDYRGDVDREWDWWSDIKMGGGTLGAIGSHAVDSLCWLLGTNITDVSCLLSTHVAERPEKSSGKMRKVTTDDTVKLMFQFADSPLTAQTTGSASLSVVESGKYQNQVEIYGTTGALMVEESGALWYSPAGPASGRKLKLFKTTSHQACATPVGHEDLRVSRVRSSRQCEQERLPSLARPRLKMVTRSNWCSTQLVLQTRAGAGLKSSKWTKRLRR